MLFQHALGMANDTDTQHQSSHACSVHLLLAAFHNCMLACWFGTALSRSDGEHMHAQRVYRTCMHSTCICAMRVGIQTAATLGVISRVMLTPHVHRRVPTCVIVWHTLVSNTQHKYQHHVSATQPSQGCSTSSHTNVVNYCEIHLPTQQFC